MADWQEVLSAWGEVLDHYEKTGKDVAYWHNEPALTGLLVTAVWRCRGSGLTEFSTERRRPGECGTGSGDAWILVGAKWYTVEAKKCDSVDGIQGKLEAAVADLQSLPERDHAHAGLALCYAVPCRLSQPTKSEIEELARSTGGVFPHASFVMAYTPVGSIPEWEGYRYPGMVVVGQFLDWARDADLWAEARR